MWVSQSGLTYLSQVFLSADGGIGVWSEGDLSRCPAPFCLGLQNISANIYIKTLALNAIKAAVNMLCRVGNRIQKE